MDTKTNCLFVQGDAARLPFPDQSVDLVFGSPLYCDARTYGIGADRDCQQWIDWMLMVTEESLRVSRGAVLWVCAGVTRKRTYWPACEGLLYEWWKRGGSSYRPCYWQRDGIPGSGGDQWFKAVIEYVLCFKRHGKLPWTDNTAMGHPPKFKPGGKISHRTVSGERVGGKAVTKRKCRGNERVDETYHPPEIANPGNLIHVKVGGGSMGNPAAHENEAPFPEKLAEWFIKSLCPPGGIVLDVFSGSGTTVDVATNLGRRGIGLDIRMSQCELGTRRLDGFRKPIHKSNPKPQRTPLFDMLEV